MKYSWRYDADNDTLLILCDGEDAGYKRAKNLENKKTLKSIIGNNKAMLLVNWAGDSLDPFEINLKNGWESWLENKISFDDEICLDDYEDGYAYLAEIYEKTANDLIVIFYYFH